MDLTTNFFFERCYAGGVVVMGVGNEDVLDGFPLKSFNQSGCLFFQ